MSDFQKQHSIYGRILGVSSTGGIISNVTSTGGRGSTAFDMALQGWGKALFETLSSDGSNIANAGISIFSTDSTSGSTHTLLAPVQGVHKEIHFHTSATAIGIDTTGGITINTTLAEAAGGGSTSVTIVGAAAGIGGCLTLRGLSSTYWSVISHTVTVSS